jgi:hypothetical protein
MAGLL